MPKWTERPASPAEHLPHGAIAMERNIELPQAKGPDGLPLVVTIRRLDVFETIARPDGLTGHEAHRYLVERSVPGLFVPNGDGPAWEALSLVDQMALIEAVGALNSEGMVGVEQAADSFRGGEPAGDVARGPGDRPGGDLEDASGEPSTSAPGDGVAATEGGAGS